MSWLYTEYRRSGGKMSTFHSHNEYEIYYFHRGCCKFIIHNSIFELKQGDIIILDGMTLHRDNPSTGHEYVRSVIQFSPEKIIPILTQLKAEELLYSFQNYNNSIIRIKNHKRHHRIDELMKRITTVYRQSNQSMINSKKLIEAESISLIVQLLFEINKLLHSNQFVQVETKSAKVHQVEKMTQWLEHHHDETITLNRLAHEFNIDKYHMSKVFRQITGFTIMEYLWGCRINKAKLHLKMHPDKSIAEISEMVGFTNVSHFSRYFRKSVGMPPLKYRNKHRGF